MAEELNINAGHGVAGRQPDRKQLDDQRLRGSDDPGMFGRMFPELPPLEISAAQITALARAMMEPERAGQPADPDPEDNPAIPSGFTYLGQFIDHDITLDLTALGDKESDVKGIRNFRSPALDLDSIYGTGPDGNPALYARDPANGNKAGPKMLIGENFEGADPAGAFRNDLPRNPEGLAIIGDHRNDENLLVAQTHLAFLKFHNKVVDRLAGTVPANQLFAEARRIVTWHYQWIVLHDFLGRLTGEPGIADRIRHDGRRFYRFKSKPYMPVEYSAAAYRFGHSMVRDSYSHNRIFNAAKFNLLFIFTGLSGGIVGDLVPVPPPSPPFLVPRLPSNWIIDWRRFYELGRPPAGTPGFVFNHSRRIDPLLAASLHSLPDNPARSLPQRNLTRGNALGLPSGQAVAAAIGIKNPLTQAEIESGPDGAVAKEQGLSTATPLWYYILKEAEQRMQGTALGPVGATIVAEVLVGLVHGDHASYLWLRKDWHPDLPGVIAGDFTMADLLRFVGDINPVGDVTP